MKSRSMNAILLIILLPTTFILASVMVSAATSDTRVSVAAMNGEMNEVRALLNENADVNAAQGDGTTALHWAAYRDDVEMVRALLQAGARTDVKTRLADITPLYMASKNGNAAI